MASVVHIAQATGSASLHFPFEELIAHLKKEGFVVKPDHYIELLKVTGTFGSEDIRALRYRLAPLVCTSEQEQERFYKVFDAYADRTRALDVQVAQARKRKRIIIYSCLGALLLIFGGWMVWSNVVSHEPPSANFRILVNGEPGNVALPTDTVLAEAIDPGNAQIQWNIGKGWTETGVHSLALSPLPLGEITVSMRAVEGKLSATAEQQLLVCEALVEQLVPDNITNLQRGSKISVTPVVRGNAEVARGALWVINGTDTIRNQASQLQYSIDSAGSYQVDYVLASGQPHCGRYSPLTFTVDPPSPLRIASIGPPPTPPSFINPWLYALFILPAAGALWQYVKSRRKRKTISITDPDALAGMGEVPVGRVEIPLEDNSMEMVAREPEMNTFFRGMRKRVEDDSQVLDIKKSIKSEILAGGLPSLVFSQRTKQLEFLLLVDRPNSNSQQLALFDYLVNLLAEENVNVDRFYFTDFTRFTNAQYPLGISLQRLSELYKSHVMVILGTGYQLLYPQLPALEKEKMKLIGEWEMRSILTPVAYGDWGPGEQALSKGFVVMPADIQGQLLLVQAITEKQFQQQDLLKTLAGNYSTGNRRYLKISQIKEYLGDEFLFQWLCAIAVYPKLRWEMMVEIGRALAEARRTPQAVNFTRLLKLVRLPWMKDGFIPEPTRLALLKELNAENEVIARKTVLDVLSRIDLVYKDDEYFQEEKRIQELTNKYVLYSHDPRSYNQYENEAKAFGERWMKGKVYDGPLLRYLDKKEGDDWHNLLDKTPSGNVSDPRRVPVERRRFPTVYAAMGVLTAAILILLLIGKPWLEKWQFGNVKFVHTDSAANQVFQFSFATDTCAVQGSDQLAGTVALDQGTVPLIFQTANRATLTAPFRIVAGRSALVEVSWGNDKTASREMILGATNDLTLTTCEPILPKPAFEILYNDPGKQDTIQLLSELLSSTFSVQTRLDSSVNASMLLINDSGRNASANIQQWVNELFGQQVKVTGSIANSASVLRLYFARTPEWTAISPANLPSALNEIWTSRSGRLITWNTRDRLLWMEEKSPDDYTTYTIQNAFVKNGVYKILLSANKEMSVLFVRNVSRSGFQFCLLPGRYAAADVTSLDESTCIAMDAAREYYITTSANASRQRERTSRVYFPLAPSSSLNSTQLKQLQGQQKGPTGPIYTTELSYARNSFFDKYPSLRIDAEKRVQPLYKILPLERGANIAVDRFSGTPFDRDYLVVQWAPSAANAQQQGYNNAPPQEEKNVQQSKEPAAVEEWQFYTRLTVNPRNLTVSYVNASEMRLLYEQLYSTADAKIKIVTYYNTPAEQKEAYAINESVRAYLEKNYNISERLGSGKVTWLVRQKTNDGIEQIIRVSMRDNVAPQEKYADIYGTNIRPAASKKY